MIVLIYLFCHSLNVLYKPSYIPLNAINAYGNHQTEIQVWYKSLSCSSFLLVPDIRDVPDSAPPWQTYTQQLHTAIYTFNPVRCGP